MPNNAYAAGGTKLCSWFVRFHAYFIVCQFLSEHKTTHFFNMLLLFVHRIKEVFKNVYVIKFGKVGERFACTFLNIAEQRIGYMCTAKTTLTE